MRSAALIFGLLAGLFGGAVIALGNLESGLAAIEALGGNRDLVAKFIVYLIPNVGLLGAGLALARPRLGAWFMLLSAAGWALVALVAGHGAVLFAALPFIFAGAGGLVAWFAARNSEADGARTEPRLAALAGGSGRRWPDEPRPASQAQPLRARSTGRSEPDFGRDTGRGAPPRFRDEPVEEAPADEDYVDAEEVFEDEPVEDDEDYVAPEEDAGPDADESEPQYEDEEEEEPAEPEPPPRRRGSWSLPDPDDEPPVRPAPTRTAYAAERQPRNPSRRQPAPPPEPDPEPPRRRPAPPPREEFDISAQDFSPPRRRSFEPRPANDYQEFEPYDPEEEEAPVEPRRSPLGGFLRLLIVLVLVVVVGGIATAVYLDYERGSQSLLFGNRHAVATASQPVPASTVEIAPAAPAVDEAPQPATAEATTVPEPEVPALQQVAPEPAAPAAVADAASTYTDPFAYCNAVDTVDAPDNRYTGPAVPHAVAAALQLPDSAPADQVHWRCASQTVAACNANHGAACDLTPTVDLMVNYCAQHPDTQNIPAPNGAWACNGKRPVIPRDQKWPVDARGFYPGAWKQVSPMNAN